MASLVSRLVGEVDLEVDVFDDERDDVVDEVDDVPFFDADDEDLWPLEDDRFMCDDELGFFDAIPLFEAGIFVSSPSSLCFLPSIFVNDLFSFFTSSSSSFDESVTSFLFCSLLLVVVLMIITG